MLALVLFLFLAGETHAHQSSLTNSGREFRWPGTSTSISINSTTPDLGAETSKSLIRESIKEWNSASPFKITEAPSLNTINFTDDFSIYGSGVVGVTEISYDSSGTIQKASILLNDSYRFRSTPGIYGGKDVYLGDVVTHELGHMLGLSHTEVLNASMFYANYAGQDTIAPDDRAGVLSKYGSGFGVISGSILGGSSVPVLGANVQAISRNSGEVISTLSLEDGSFQLRGLDLDDSYYLYISPLRYADAMPGYFSNVQNDFCPGSYVGSFFQACGRENDGYPQTITLSSLAPQVNVGVITIGCSLRNQQDYVKEKLEGENFRPLLIFDFAREQLFEKAFVGYFTTKTSYDWSHWDRLEIDLRGYSPLSPYPEYLQLSLSGQKFGNQLEYEMEIARNGTTLPGMPLRKNTIAVPAELDLFTRIPLSPTANENIFEVRIRAKRIDSVLLSQSFPMYEQFTRNKDLPYLLIAGITDSPEANSYRPLLNTALQLSDNRSCLDAPFTYKVARANTPSASAKKDSGREQAASAAGCGSIDADGSGGGGNGMLTLSLGFLLAMLATSLRKSPKKFLS